MKQANDPGTDRILTTRFHLYALIGCLIYTAAFGLLTRGRIFSDVFILTFILMITQVELFAWIGSKVFKNLIYNTVQEFIQKVFLRLIIFYLFVVIIAGVLFVGMTAVWSYSNGVELGLFFKQLPEKELRGFIIGSSFGLLIGTVIYFFLELLEVIKRIEKTTEEKIRYQYETLKNQLNPHFLFNSLNTLSTIIYKDIALADHYIVKLSSIYRYILDQNENKLINLENELAFVKDFFALQQMRDEDRIQLEINISQPEKYQILPVSLQLLVENALKHNSATTAKPLLIRIYGVINGYIEVENNRQPKQLLSDSFQIGLKNLAERVRIITGKELQIDQNHEYFRVKIPIVTL
ncbi:MAG: histidine kinase [Mariniphaga sp.]